MTTIEKLEFDKLKDGTEVVYLYDCHGFVKYSRVIDAIKTNEQVENTNKVRRHILYNFFGEQINTVSHEKLLKSPNIQVYLQNHNPELFI